MNCVKLLDTLVAGRRREKATQEKKERNATLSVSWQLSAEVQATAGRRDLQRPTRHRQSYTHPPMRAVRSVKSAQAKRGGSEIKLTPALGQHSETGPEVKLSLRPYDVSDVEIKHPEEPARSFLRHSPSLRAQVARRASAFYWRLRTHERRGR